MDLKYNIDFEITGVILLLVIYSAMAFYYSGQSEINKRFKNVVKYLLLAEIMDIATAVTISFGAKIPPVVNIIANTLYFLCMFAVGYVFMRYTQNYISEKIAPVKKIVQKIIYMAFAVVLLINVFSGLLFSFDQEGRYIHGTGYLFVYFVPLYYIVTAAWELLKYHRQFKKKQQVSIGLYIVMSLAGPLMQLLLFPNILLGVFTPSVAALVILFSMETPDYQMLLKTLAELHALRKSLDEEVKRQTKTAEDRMEKMERLSEQVILTLAKTIDAKDKYTSGHSERVAKYAKEIAGRMGMSKREQREIYYMGILHDIGKIGIPDAIINKKGKLTDEEFQIIKSHPVIGAEVLENIEEIPNISIGAKFHHERYDGTGYPEHKAGEDIPIQARIIGISDAYDAMTSKRSYRDLLPQEVVRSEIEKGKGTQFDPVCAKFMLMMIDEDKEYRMRE